MLIGRSGAEKAALTYINRYYRALCTKGDFYTGDPEMSKYINYRSARWIAAAWIERL